MTTGSSNLKIVILKYISVLASHWCEISGNLQIQMVRCGRNYRMYIQDLIKKTTQKLK